MIGERLLYIPSAGQPLRFLDRFTDRRLSGQVAHIGAVAVELPKAFSSPWFPWSFPGSGAIAVLRFFVSLVLWGSGAVRCECRPFGQQ